MSGVRRCARAKNAVSVATHEVEFKLTVLVTGVGFIGGYVVRDLLAAGEEVVIFGYLGGNGDPQGELPELDYLNLLTGGEVRDRVKIVIGDVSDLTAMTKAAERNGVSKIAHLATILSAGAEARPHLAAEVNVMGTANAFETAARLGLNKVVWTSSNSVFGPRSIPESGIVTDTSVFDPLYTYGAAKLFGERLASTYADKFGVNITGVRPSRVYGFGEHVKLGRGGGSSWLSNLLYRPAIGESPVSVPFGGRSLDFTYVEDLSDGIVRALRWNDPAGSDNYNLSGDYRKISSAFDFVKRLLPEADLRLEGDPPSLAPGATMGFEMRCDSSRAAKAFGYNQRHSMEAGVFKTINQNRIMAGFQPLQPPPEAKVN